MRPCRLPPPRHRPRPRTAAWRGLAALLLGWAATAAPVLAQDAPAGDRPQSVAQVVYGILTFTRWPSEPQTIRLCIVGPTAHADELLRGLPSPRTRPIAVRRVPVDDPDLAARCDALYAGTLDADAWRRHLAALGATPLLSIGERQELCGVGCMICLDTRPPGVTFESNPDSVARSGVRVDVRVLHLSRRRAPP